MLKCIIIVLLIISTQVVLADEITQIVFFGDSLTDNGNLYHSTLKVIPKSPPYYKGRFSNGPSWAELVGDYYHEKQGIQYQIEAVGGATVILRGPWQGALPYTVGQELTHYLTRSPADKSHILYALWVGANDYLDEQKQEVNALNTDVVNGIFDVVNKLMRQGAKHFLLFNMPDLSKTPFAATANSSIVSRFVILSHLNQEKMASMVNKLRIEHPDKTFVLIDIYELFNTMFDHLDQYNEKYNTHISNLTQSCWQGWYILRNEPVKQQIEQLAQELNTANSTAFANHVLSTTSLAEAHFVNKLQAAGIKPCDNPDDYMFWDKVHPTRVMHQILAQTVIEQLNDVYFIKNKKLGT